MSTINNATPPASPHSSTRGGPTTGIQLGHKVRPPYVLARRKRNFLEVFHADTGIQVGYAYNHGYPNQISVWALGGVDGEERVGSVAHSEMIISALVSFLQAHPREWLREGPRRYTRLTDYGVLEIREHYDSELWEVLRDGIHLWYRDGPAVFCDKDEAQRVADAHMSEGFPNSGYVSDKFEWKSDADPWWQSETSGTRGPRKASRPYSSDEISPGECSDQPTATLCRA
jgi:hypothetical protein